MWFKRFDCLLVSVYRISVLENWKFVRVVAQGNSQDKDAEKNPNIVEWDRHVGEVFQELSHYSSWEFVSTSAAGFNAVYESALV